MLTIVQLARAGDIISIIPAIDAMRKGGRVNWLVHEHFAPILENLSWVDIHVWKGGDSQVTEAAQHAAKYIGGEILAVQVHGNAKPRTQPNFILDQWARAGMLERFHDCPLVFDRLQSQIGLPREHDGPVMGLALSGHSSPFRHAPALKTWLLGLQTQFRCVDLSDLRGASAVSLLQAIRECDLLLTIDSALLHLAYAVGTPTIALSRPLEWYMSEPRWHWIERLTYDDAIQPEGKSRIEQLMRRSIAELKSMRGSMCRAYSPPDPSRPIEQVVDWYDATGETDRRHRFAADTWNEVAKQDGHWAVNLHFMEAGQRSSKDLGDTRSLPYLKDVIDWNMRGIEDDTIVVLTNADTCIFPEAPAEIRRQMNRKPCICSGRIDISRIARPLKMAEMNGARIYVGTDLFCFTPQWWASVRDKIPDMLIACEGWDFVLYKMMERDNPAARSKCALCYHEIHPAFWSNNLLNNPGQQHNRRLGRQWAVDFGFQEYLDDGQFLFRSTPKTAGRAVRKIPAAEPVEMAEIVSGDVTGMPVDGELAKMIETVIMRVKPARILETGTYLGMGSTRIIIDALKKHGLAAEVVSIECNAEHFAAAGKNLSGEKVRLINAISIPRDRLPTREAIELATVKHPIRARYIDHLPEDRAEKYFAETDFPAIEDDAIGKTLERWHGAADLVILDSAGHLGRIEFQYLVARLRAPCVIIFDDAHHAKHAQTLADVRRDRRFEIVVEGDERFGFAILDFTPRPSGRLLPRLRQLT